MSRSSCFTSKKCDLARVLQSPLKTKDRPSYLVSLGHSALTCVERGCRGNSGATCIILSITDSLGLLLGEGPASGGIGLFVHDAATSFQTAETISRKTKTDKVSDRIVCAKGVTVVIVLWEYRSYSV